MSRVIPFPAVGPVANDGSAIVSLAAPLRAAVAASRRRHRSLIAAAGAWALARGVSLPADHVALWAVAADALGSPGDVGGTTGPWRASALPGLLTTLSTWCAAAGCLPPTGLTETLWHLYGFLAATGRLHPSSDPLTELRAALVVFGGLERLDPESSSPPEPTAA